ncbi:hypothetical protein [Nonomuraea sp. JJY05]|uniref:hypothetical protein n=1 Tax=Nonomuraea sp. JJY05 TaxID=3350255 RepID=UPI00373EDCB8
MFAVRTLYDQFGREIYARAAADPTFSAAISAQVAELRELEESEPQLSKLLSGKSGKVALDFYLLGDTHAVLTGLLEAALRPDARTPASVDPDFAAVRLGAVFPLAFDGGRPLRPPLPDDRCSTARPGTQRRPGHHIHRCLVSGLTDPQQILNTTDLPSSHTDRWEVVMGKLSRFGLVVAGVVVGGALAWGGVAAAGRLLGPTVTVVKESRQVPKGYFGTNVVCPEGQQAIGGGYAYHGDHSLESPVTVEVNAPETTSDKPGSVADAWGLFFLNPKSKTITVEVSVICAPIG